jgi:hypothetical protein
MKVETRATELDPSHSFNPSTLIAEGSPPPDTSWVGRGV